MSKKLLTLNIFFAIADVIVAVIGIAVFAGAAWFFEKWWLTLFSLIPLVLYNSHTLVIDQDIQLQEESQKGGESNASET